MGMLRSGMQVEIDLAGHPLLVALGEECGNEAQTRGGIGEDRSDAGAALEFAVDAFEAVGGSQAGTLAVRQFEDGEALGQVLLGPQGELGRLERIRNPTAPTRVYEPSSSSVNVRFAPVSP